MALRVGVIGAGLMGAGHVRTLATQVAGAEVVAVSDADHERAASVARDTGGCRVHAEALDLIRDTDVEAVLVASPAETHEKFVLACLDVGKPVLCEKPLAPTPEACRRVIEAEVAVGRRLIQLGFMRRFDPAYAEMKRVLDSGAIGTALVMHCTHRNPGTPPSFTSDMIITDAAIHELDVTRWLLGEEIVAATVHSPRASGLIEGGLRDPQLVVLQTQSGALVDVEIFANARYGYDIRCELVGESGTVSLLPPATVTTRVEGTDGQRVPQDFRERFAAAYRGELTAWVEGAAAGQVRGPDAWDGYAAIEAAQACLESLATGRTARVQPALRPSLYG